MLSDNNLLIRTLRLNALFSGVSAVLMFIAGNWLASQFNLTSALPVHATGGLLALFALQLANIVRTRRIRSWEITAIIGGDIAWVAGSVLIVALYYPSMTAAAVLLTAVVAMAVLFFAIRQARGLRQYRRMSKASRSCPGNPQRRRR